MRKNDLDEVHHRLREYGDWLIRNGSRMSGWGENRTSIEYRMIQGMAKDTRPRGGLSYWKMPKHIEEIHLAYIHMPDKNRHAIWVKWLAPRRNAGGAMGLMTNQDMYRLAAAERGISVTTLMNRIRSGESYLAGYLDNARRP